MSGERPPGERVAQLREAFDASFALPPASSFEEVVDFLAIRLDGNGFLVRLGEVAELVSRGKIVPVPAAARGLLGLAGHRGSLVPVFGLASRVGYGDEPGSPPWMLLCGTEMPIALAFSNLEGHVRLPRSAVVDDPAPNQGTTFARSVAETPTGLRRVLDLNLVVAAIRNQAGHPRLQGSSHQ